MCHRTTPKNRKLMKHVVIALSFITSLLLSSCDTAGSFMNASGSANEVLVVMDDSLWEGEAGSALFDVLNSNAKGLPQPEANFNIIQIAPENFTRTIRMARNVITPDISNIYSSSKFTADIDKYATGQVIMTIQSPDTAAFAAFVTENSQSIIDYFVTKELERNGKFLKQQISEPLSRAQQMFGINIHLPKGLTNVTEHPNFYWATNNAPQGRKDVVIYQFPYTTETVFEKDSLIAIRNRTLGEFIKGSFDSKMTTAAIYPPDYRRIEVDGIFRAELRGLWEMTTDMMGGPFVMQAFVNDNTGMVVVVETYVYAPESNKRNLMRNLEATFYTISLPQHEGVEIVS